MRVATTTATILKTAAGRGVSRAGLLLSEKNLMPILLWLLGVPISVIILLMLFGLLR